MENFLSIGGYVKMFKTLKSYIKAIEVIEKQPLCDLKGYEKLTPQQRELLGLLSAGISNYFNEFLEIDSQK